MATSTRLRSVLLYIFCLLIGLALSEVILRLLHPPEPRQQIRSVATDRKLSDIVIDAQQLSLDNTNSPTIFTAVLRNDTGEEIELVGYHGSCDEWTCLWCESPMPAKIAPRSSLNLQMSISVRNRGPFQRIAPFYIGTPQGLLTCDLVVSGLVN